MGQPAPRIADISIRRDLACHYVSVDTRLLIGLRILSGAAWTNDREGNETMATLPAVQAVDIPVGLVAGQSVAS
jgi:hypothetical protein